MTELRKEGCNEIGFVDPHIVFKDPVTPKTNWKSQEGYTHELIGSHKRVTL